MKRLLATLFCLLLLLTGSAKAVVVRVETVIGSFDINMREDAAPATVANFLNYVRDRDFDNTFFHRSVPGFVVQTGGYRFAGDEFTSVPEDPPIVNEFNLSNIRGTVAMAKFAGDPDSATSQWFINLADNSGNLDNQNGGFTVFGEIESSDMVIADAVGDVPDIIPGVEIDIIDGRNIPPLSGTDFAPALATLPALNFDQETDFVPSENLVLITAMRETGPDLLVEPDNLDFGLLVAGEAAERSVTLTNRGLAALEVSSAETTGSPAFSVSANACSVPVELDGICEVTVRFGPAAAGSFSGSLVLSSNDPDSAQTTIPLSGDASAVPEPRISLSPDGDLDFGSVEIDDSGTLNLVISNVGSGVLSVDTVDISGMDAAVFSQINECGEVAPGSDCTIAVTFQPVDGLAFTANLVINSNDPLNPSVLVALSGDGVVPLEPDIDIVASVDFGQVAVNDFRTNGLLLRNTGEGVLEISAITFGGANASDFVVTDNCGETVLPGGGCSISVTFRPRTGGAKEASVMILSDDPDESTVTILLTGLAEGTVEPIPDIDTDHTALEFGNFTVGIPHVRELRIQNTLGTGDLIIESIDIVGLNAREFGLETDCSILEPEGDACTVTVTLLADTTGSKSATLVIGSNDPDEPQVRINMDGQASASPDQDISVVPGMADFGEVAVGSSITEKIEISNEGLLGLVIEAVELTAGGDAGFDMSENCPDLLGIGGACTIDIVFTATETGRREASITITSDDPDEAMVIIPVAAQGANDSDGVDDATEDAHPQKTAGGRGDGNGDGIADALQSNVASLRNIHGNYVTIVSSGNTRLLEVKAVENPFPGSTPTGFGANVSFPQGFFEYTIKGVTDPVTVTMIFDEGTRPTNLFKIGSTSDNVLVHWYPFDFDGVVGADAQGDRMVIHFVDGLRGDSDLQINGTILDPIAPAMIEPLSVSVKNSNGGCTVSRRDTPPIAAADRWLLFLLLTWLGTLRIRRGRAVRRV